MRTLMTNIVGAFIAFALAGIVFGEQLESLLFPILVGPRLTDGAYLPDPIVSNIHWVGQGETARLWWQVDFCKPHPAVLSGSGNVFFYIRAPERPGIPIRVTNETTGTSFGSVPMPAACFRVQYSADLPDDPPASQGDYIISEVVYKSPHGFWWSIHGDFGMVTVPSPPPS